MRSTDRDAICISRPTTTFLSFPNDVQLWTMSLFYGCSFAQLHVVVREVAVLDLTYPEKQLPAS